MAFRQRNQPTHPISIYFLNLRQELNLSQEQMANKLGISSRAYQRLEYNQVDMTKKTMEKIGKALGKNPGEIFFLDFKLN